MSYNGSGALADSAIDTNIRNTISAYCRNGNICVIHCYSAGCLRMLKAVADLAALGKPAVGLQWAEASGSAAGGSPLANIATGALTGMFAKLIGMQEPIDFDITPGAARGRWLYVQGAFGKTVYHVAGTRDTCKTLLGLVRICGNPFINNGAADGLVSFASAAGYSDTGAYTNACGSNKYPYRAYDTDVSTCSGVDRDHLGIHEVGAQAIALAGAGTYTNRNLQWSDSNLPSGLCSTSGGTCDNAFSNTAARFCRLPNGTQIAGCTGSNASISTGATAGTCAAHCGGRAVQNGRSCWCDPRCIARGDCCSDYQSSNCANVLGVMRQPVHRGHNAGTATHFYTHDLQQLAQAGAVERINAFFVYADPVMQGSTSAFYRCSIAGKYLLTTRSDCWDPQRGAFGTGATLVGYIPPTRWDAASGNPTSDLFELYKAGDRIYTVDAAEKNSLVSGGWSHVATWYAWAN
jgi:hypothetical protein